MKIKTISDLKDFLKNRVFTIESKGVYLFEGDAYAILHGNISLFMKRGDVPFKALKRKYKYSIFQYESNFIFRTYENELNSGSNEFLISVKENRDKTYTVTFLSVTDKNDSIHLLSD